MAAVSASQAWAILARHARDEIAPLRLQELCRDNDRVSSLVAVHNMSETASERTSAASENEHRILLVDLSRQRMTLDTINHLLQLAAARNVKGFIQMLAWGQNDPNDPIVPLRSRRSDGTSKNKSRFEDGLDDANNMRGKTFRAPSRTSPTMHLALRAPAGCGLEMLTADGNNALIGIHNEWERIQRLSDSIRHGKLRGVSGSAIRDVVVVGRGVPVMALRFLYQALLRDKTAQRATLDGSNEGRHRRGNSGEPSRRMRFISSIDPIAAASALSDLDPGSTIVVSIDLRGNDEIALVTRACKSWLLNSLGANKRVDLIFNKHMLLVTGNKGKAAGHKAESVFLIPGHSRCEAFTTFTAATLLPLSVVFGWKIVGQILSGAHDLDSHFVETNPRHNLPVLLALTDLWNDAFLGSFGRVVTPFTETFSAFPAFVAALEAQTCGRTTDPGSQPHIGMDRSSCSAMVMDGGLQGSYDRALYQCGRVMPSELVMAMDTQAATNTSHTMGLDGLDEVLANQDILMCSLFAHADTLAFGTEGHPPIRNSLESPMLPPEGLGNVSATLSALDDPDVAEGNRPSALLICGKCDAFTCGQLVALSEHRAVVKAHLWDIDPFARSVGSSLRVNRSEKLKEELHKMYSKIATPGNSEVENDDTEEQKGLNMSTSTILGHYANLMRDERIYIVKGS